MRSSVLLPLILVFARATALEGGIVVQLDQHVGGSRGCGGNDCDKDNGTHHASSPDCHDEELIIANVTDQLMYVQNGIEDKIMDSTKDLKYYIDNSLYTTQNKLFERNEAMVLDYVRQLYCALEKHQYYLNGSCYTLSTDTANWEDARQNCQDKGGDLLVTDTYDEFVFFLGKVQENHWVGLSDIDTEGTYVFVDGTEFVPADDWFHSGEPNDNGNHEQNCIHYWKNGDSLKYDDVACSDVKKYICETRVNDIIF